MGDFCTKIKKCAINGAKKTNLSWWFLIFIILLQRNNLQLSKYYYYVRN